MHHVGAVPAWVPPAICAASSKARWVHHHAGQRGYTAHRRPANATRCAIFPSSSHWFHFTRETAAWRFLPYSSLSFRAWDILGTSLFSATLGGIGGSSGFAFLRKLYGMRTEKGKCQPLYLRLCMKGDAHDSTTCTPSEAYERAVMSEASTSAWVEHLNGSSVERLM